MQSAFINDKLVDKLVRKVFEIFRIDDGVYISLLCGVNWQR